ncbi:unnamed protein product [Leptosia nina]|uniref:Uncharacterized protein n=1 Tax=Leptosia nina TaxID=320188 RepID=A0AAV1JTQ4_9NEOP
MKKLFLIIFSMFFVFNSIAARPADPNFDLQLDENGFPKGWFFGKCDGCRIHNIGNGENNTNTIYIKDKK